jgi:hypothetical protein
MKKIVFEVLLLISLSTSIHAHRTPLSGDEIDSLLGSAVSFSREEVRDLIGEILTLADEEIRRTAEEAVKEAILAEKPEAAFQKSLAESWEKEAARHAGNAEFFKALSVVEAAALGGMGLYIGIREATR